MNTNRRNFLGMMVGGVVGAAAMRAWPFRVYSFPSEIRMPADWEWVDLVQASDIRLIENMMDMAGWQMALTMDRIVLAA